VAVWQRINLFSRPVLAFFAGFAALMGGLYAWLAGLPPERMAQMIGLLGSGLIVSIIALFVAVAAWQRIDVYESFVDGAKEGFAVAVQIIPYLIAMLAAISVFRSTGGMDYLIGGIRTVVLALGLNADFVPALPVGLMKTLSGSGARGLMVDVMTTYGVDSFPGKLAAIIQGSTETTFYVLAVYFGSVNITKTRYALACGLIADAVGLVGAILIGYAFYH
jgi:spore maturation protein SpmB